MHKLIFTTACITILSGCMTSKKTIDPPSRVYKLSLSDASLAAKKVTEECKTVTEPEIKDLLIRFSKAIKARNVPQILALYDRDALIIPATSEKSHQTFIEKRNYFQNITKVKNTLTINTQTIEIHCNVVTDFGTHTLSNDKTGEKTTSRYSHIYKWNGKQWQITREHTSIMPSNA